MVREVGRRIPQRSLEDTRVLAMDAIDRGKNVDDVAETLQIGRSTLYGWIKERKEKGEAWLTVGTSTGRPPKLTDRQRAQLKGLIIGSDPRQMELPFALWTRKIVRDVIIRKFGVGLTDQQVGNILRDLGLSPQRPLTRPCEQDPEKVQKWKEETYPAIRAQAKKEGATIYFADEAGVRSDYHTGTTWGEVGSTPIVYGSGKKFSVNLVSAISAQGSMHFRLFDGNMNARAFIEYLKDLLHDIQGKIFLIIDGAPYHRAKAVAKFAEDSGRLKLFFLPSYSPQLNPDEWAWKNIKVNTGLTPITTTEVKSQVKYQDGPHRVPQGPVASPGRDLPHTSGPADPPGKRRHGHGRLPNHADRSVPRPASLVARST